MGKRKRRLQRQRKWCGEGSIGHGTKTRIKPLEKLSGKIKRFKDTKNHCWSRYIVDQAVKRNCGTIQMEDLSGIATDNNFLKTWTYDDLQQKIKYKAEEKGIEVIKIKPAHTSGRCSCCGHIHRSKDKKDWRPTQEQFICQSCGVKMNADHNAAKNIATKDIEKLIKKQLEKQEKELKHNMKYVI
jgi:putative transposase